MRKIVQQYEAGKFRPWNPSMPVATYQDTVAVHYGDGREPRNVNVAELNEKPYVVIRHLTSVDNWTPEELAACFLYEPRDFEEQPGMRRVGEASYVIDADNSVREVYEQEPIPPEPVRSQRTPLEKLAEVAGLSVEEMADAVVEAGERAGQRPTRTVGEIAVPRL